MGEPDLGLDSRAHVIVSEIRILTRPLLLGKPDLGLGCLAMVCNNKLRLWQEQFNVNITD